MPKLVLGHQQEGTITVAVVPPSDTFQEMVRSVCHNDGVWRAHSTGGDPAWVECEEDPELAQAVADNYGCPVGRPE